MLQSPSVLAAVVDPITDKVLPALDCQRFDLAGFVDNQPGSSCPVLKVFFWPYLAVPGLRQGDKSFAIVDGQFVAVSCLLETGNIRES